MLVPGASIPVVAARGDARGGAGMRARARVLDGEAMLAEAAAAEGHEQFGEGTHEMLAAMVDSLRADARREALPRAR